ncbi:MAG: hypothetical protein A2Y12_14405 [Planctomycetes bacterium GWF2_42_9]|nr:MAG: hypothetical protein A2Y12_14405 [Planctomycetes bacterium GWF2_42_9]HAL45465.1 hypothetical protein [Phycisphaerales bacterium]
MVKYLALLFVVVFVGASVLPVCAQNPTNMIAPNMSNSDPNDINDTNNIIGIAEVEGPNNTSQYIGGDAFNLEFEPIFKNYVDPKGLVNYAKLRRHRAIIGNMLQRLANIEPEVFITWSRNEKIAFWINTYNVCTLKGIVEEYPISPSRFMLLFYPADSVMHIRGLRDETYFMIMGIQYTLDEIESEALLARFEDPRICLAVNYGTISSAPLRAEPYIGKVIDNQLDEQVRNYFSTPNGLQIDQNNNIVRVSPIFRMYKWHEDAFVKAYGTNKLFREREPVERAILNFIKDYVSPANAQYLKQNKYTIEYLKYDWKLNDQQND